MDKVMILQVNISCYYDSKSITPENVFYYDYVRTVFMHKSR